VTEGRRLILSVISNVVNAAIPVPLSAEIAKVVFGHGSKHFATGFTVLECILSGVGIWYLVPIFQRIISRFGESSGSPPTNAEFLFHLFLTPANCDALVGDLEERYRTIRRKFGKHRADFWYWTQTIRSVGPIVWAWAKKILRKPVIGLIGWAIAKGLIGHDSWLAVVVELWRRIRS
jgi:hypothetical protein